MYNYLGRVMIWGSMAWNGVGNLEFIDGIMTKEVYLDLIQKNLPETARKLRLSRQYTFQQDGDPKHTAKIVSQWFQKKKISVLEWPAQSPDLNPIEHLWSILKQKIRERGPRNLSDLKAIVLEEWNKITTDVCQKLVESMPRRCQAVIDSKGGHTKY